MTPCTHTSDWWKEMLPCVSCGAAYSDEEAERIAKQSSSETAEAENGGAA